MEEHGKKLCLYLEKKRIFRFVPCFFRSTTKTTHHLTFPHTRLLRCMYVLFDQTTTKTPPRSTQNQKPPKMPPKKTPAPPTSGKKRASTAASPSQSPAASARATAAEYNKALRMTSSGAGGSSKIYSTADSWAAAFKPRAETKVFANAVGYPRDLQLCPFRVPGRENCSLPDDPVTKHSGADIHVGVPDLRDDLLRGLPKSPLGGRDGKTPYWHRGWETPENLASRAGSPDPKSACTYFNEAVHRAATTVPTLSIAIVPAPASYDEADAGDETRKIMMELMQGAHDMDAAYERGLQERIKQKQEAVEKERALVFKKTVAARAAVAASRTGCTTEAAAVVVAAAEHPPSKEAVEQEKEQEEDQHQPRQQSQHRHKEQEKSKAPVLARDIPTPGLVAIAAVEMLDDTKEGHVHRTRDVFAERYTKLPKMVWDIRSVSRPQRIEARNDAARRIQRWFRNCKKASALRQKRRDFKVAREGRARHLVMVESGRIKLRHAVSLHVQRFTGVRRRVMAMRVVKAMRLGCKTRICAAKAMLSKLKEVCKVSRRAVLEGCRQDFAAIQIQRVWRGVRMRFVARVMLHVFGLARATFDQDLFDTKLKLWVYQFSFRRLRRYAATQLQRCWRRFILRRDVNMSRFLHTVELPCPASATARRERVEERTREIHAQQLARLEREIASSHSSSPLMRIYAAEQKKRREEEAAAASGVSSSLKKRPSSPLRHKRPLTLDEISRLIGEHPPPISTTFAEGYYNKTLPKNVAGFDFMNPVMMNAKQNPK